MTNGKQTLGKGVGRTVRKKNTLLVKRKEAHKAKAKKTAQAFRKKDSKARKPGNWMGY